MPLPVHTDPRAAVPELTTYLRNELDPQARQDFEAHLPRCERCRKAVAVAGSLFPGMAQPPPTAGATPSAADLLAQMEAQLARTRERNRRLQDSRRRNLLWALGVLAALACLGAIGFTLLANRAGLAHRVTTGGAP
jgi:anti-sigma factor RsiW